MSPSLSEPFQLTGLLRLNTYSEGRMYRARDVFLPKMVTFIRSPSAMYSKRAARSRSRFGRRDVNRSNGSAICTSLEISTSFTVPNGIACDYACQGPGACRGSAVCSFEGGQQALTPSGDQ